MSTLWTLSTLVRKHPNPILNQETSNSPKMAKPRTNQIQSLILILILSVTHYTICAGVSSKPLYLLKSSDLGAKVERLSDNCTRVVEEEEYADKMDSESNKRVLMMQPRRRYVSYDTLRKDLVPCERPGASYYNCRSGGVANPYTRGCEMITGCARSIRDIKT